MQRALSTAVYHGKRLMLNRCAIVRRYSSDAPSSDVPAKSDLLQRELYLGNRVARILLNSPKKRLINVYFVDIFVV
jgi:hypothetical protein